MVRPDQVVSIINYMRRDKNALKKNISPAISVDLNAKTSVNRSQTLSSEEVSFQ